MLLCFLLRVCSFSSGVLGAWSILGEVVFGVGTVPGGVLVWKPACPSSCGTSVVYMVCAPPCWAESGSESCLRGFAWCVREACEPGGLGGARPGRSGQSETSKTGLSSGHSGSIPWSSRICVALLRLEGIWFGNSQLVSTEGLEEP